MGNESINEMPLFAAATAREKKEEDEKGSLQAKTVEQLRKDIREFEITIKARRQTGDRDEADELEEQMVKYKKELALRQQ